MKKRFPIKELYQINIKDKRIIKSYKTIAEAYRITNIKEGHISAVLDKPKRTAGGYIWRCIRLTQEEYLMSIKNKKKLDRINESYLIDEAMLTDNYLKNVAKSRNWGDTKLRICLTCGYEFYSIGIYNRRCKECLRKEEMVC